MRPKWGRRVLVFSESVLSTHGGVYTFAALYIIVNILLFLGHAVEESRLHNDYRRFTTAIARGSGATINFNMAVVILLASRSTMGILRETPLNMVLPIDKAMPEMHRLVGILILLAGVLHVACHIPWYVIDNPWALGLKAPTALFITGFLLLTLLVIIRLVARPAIYHANYELFFRTHVGGSVLVVVLLLLHGFHRGIANTWKWVVGPIVIYLLDIVLRSFREKRSYLLVSKHSAALQGTSIVKIRLPRVFHFEAGQYAEIKVPQLSRLQWHPFTIASAPHEPEIVFYIKAVGDWTRALYQLFSNRLTSDDAEDIEIHIRGPYGAPAQHVGQFDRVILIGGGVGATPFCSVVKDAHNWITNWSPRHQRREPRRRGRENTRAANINDNEVFASMSFDGSDSSPVTGDHDESLSSHLFTTNVISERLLSGESFVEIEPPRRDTAQKSSGRRAGNSCSTGIKYGDTAPKEGDSLQNKQESDSDTGGNTTMHTARDYLIQIESENGTGSAPPTHSGGSPTDGGVSNKETTEEKRGGRGKRAGERKKAGSRRQIKHDEYEDGERMGTYHENSAGTHHRSMDYMTALHTVYYEDDGDEVFQKSLSMMVTMNFGSVSLVRNMQIKKAQRDVRQGRADSLATLNTEISLNMFKNPRIMFLLYMRSVTVNMLILWILLLRFTVAGATFTFDRFRLFQHGIALYDIVALNAIDLIVTLVLSVLIGLPSLVEMFELGTGPLHGFELFVLMPIGLAGVVVDAMALFGYGKDVDKLFNVFHVFVVWPILTILVLIRLLRVVGERIAQAENVATTHSTTKAVDFFWTAPLADDDRWLVGELNKFTDIRQVRMHRYLTRDKPSQPNNRNDNSESVPTRSLIRTNYGRPNWEEIFNHVAEGCRNNTTIGVFFCGPHSMGRAVQDACMGAMRNSIVRGLQNAARAMRGLEEIFGEAITANEYTGDVCRTTTKSGGEVGGNWGEGRGCNVTIVFKRESFS